MKTDDEKSFRLFSDKKTGENLSFSRASIYFGRKREREREERRRRVLSSRVLLSALFFVFVFSRVSQTKEVVQKERRTFQSANS